MKYTCNMETVEQNGRLKLFYSKFPYNIVSILFVWPHDPPSPFIYLFLAPSFRPARWHFSHIKPIPFISTFRKSNSGRKCTSVAMRFLLYIWNLIMKRNFLKKIYISVFWCFFMVGYASLLPSILFLRCETIPCWF